MEICESRVSPMMKPFNEHRPRKQQPILLPETNARAIVSGLNVGSKHVISLLKEKDFEKQTQNHLHQEILKLQASLESKNEDAAAWH